MFGQIRSAPSLLQLQLEAGWATDCVMEKRVMSALTSIWSLGRLVRIRPLQLLMCDKLYVELVVVVYVYFFISLHKLSREALRPWSLYNDTNPPPLETH
jgi:hypothetical protein